MIYIQTCQFPSKYLEGTIYKIIVNCICVDSYHYSAVHTGNHQVDNAALCKLKETNSSSRCAIPIFIKMKQTQERYDTNSKGWVKTIFCI